MATETTRTVECVECQEHYNRNKQRYCPNCGERDCNDLDPFEERERKLNDLDLGEIIGGAVRLERG